jgi:predicted nucleic acid-binding protein
MHLVDTNVLSAGAPKAANAAALVAWMDQPSSDLCLSVVSVAEFADGIAKLRRQGSTPRANGFAAWLETLLHLYGERVLPFDLAAARIAGALSDRARADGMAPGFADLAIAATARVHGLTILTRNARHFRLLQVVFLDPFAALPP